MALADLENGLMGELVHACATGRRLRNDPYRFTGTRSRDRGTSPS